MELFRRKFMQFLSLFAISVVLALFVLESHSGDRKPYTCEAILNAESYELENPYHPTFCLFKRYDTPEVVNCLSELADRNLHRKGRRNWHIAFMGDSRIRQLYHSFTRLIPLDDAEVLQHSGHKALRYVNIHLSSYFRSSLFNVVATFHWTPFMNEHMKRELQDWINGSSIPDVLVIGNALWTAVRLPNPLRAYEAHLTAVQPLLKQLAGKTNIIWWNQDPMDEKMYFFRRKKDESEPMMENTFFAAYNEISRNVLRQTGITVWDSTGVIYNEYVRSCAANDGREDSQRFWVCRDPFHSGFSVNYFNNEQLMNYLCNPIMNVTHPYCCSN